MDVEAGDVANGMAGNRGEVLGLVLPTKTNLSPCILGSFQTASHRPRPSPTISAVPSAQQRLKTNRGRIREDPV